MLLSHLVSKYCGEEELLGMQCLLSRKITAFLASLKTRGGNRELLRNKAGRRQARICSQMTFEEEALRS